MSTTYPAAIDTSISLATVVDGTTPIKAIYINQLRDAILQIESTLGVNPAGNYGTIANSLITLEGIVGNLQVISLANDLGGTLASPLVIGIQGRPISSILPTIGQVLTWNGIAWIPSSSSVSTDLFGDVTGTTNLSTVVNIHGASVPVAGALTIGNTLQVIGSSTLTYAPINLAGGSNYVTGALPNANQAAQTMSGDVTGTTAASVVAKIQDNPIKAQSLGAAQDGYVLTWVNADGYWEAVSSGGNSNPPLINLGTASTFGVLGGSTITNTGPSVIHGDLGLTPGSSVTGAPTVTGATHIDDTIAVNAQSALTAAYIAAQALPGAVTIATNLGGQTLTPGVYSSLSGTFAITGGQTLTLNGAGNYTFQMATTLVTGTSSIVLLAGGATAANVTFAVGSSATLGTTTTFVGNILALTSITDNGGSTVNGRLLARNGAVTLNDTTVTVPSSGGGSGTLSGDVTGAIGANTVVKIQGTPVSTNSVVNDGYALVSTGGVYVPTGVEPVYNVKNFGAKGDGVTDDTVAIQTAIDRTPNFSTLYFPEGVYIQTAPLIMRFHSIVMSGPQGPTSGNLSGGAILRYSSTPNAQFPVDNLWTGPQLIIGGQAQPYPITQVGNFYCLNFPTLEGTPLVDFSESDVGILNGIGAVAGIAPNSGFTFECWFNPQNHNPPNPGDLTIIAVSCGRRDLGYANNAPIDNAFGLSMNQNYTLNVHIKTTAGTADFGTVTTVPTNALTHVAVTLDNLGNVKCFINGVLDAHGFYSGGSSAALGAGTIVQQPWEDFTMGYKSGQWVLGVSLGGTFGPVLFSSIRVSNRCWYTTTFTPSTTELTVDLNKTTMILLNFDPVNMVFGGGWIVGYSSLGRHNAGDPVYCFLGHSAVFPLLGNCIVQNLNFFGGSEAIYCYGANGMIFRNLAINCGNKGISILGSYDNVIDRCLIGVGSSNTCHSWCIGCFDGQPGPLNRIYTCNLAGGLCTIMTVSGFAIYDCLINFAPSLMGIYSCGALPNDGELIMTNCIWDDEGVVTSDSGAYISGMANALLRNNILQGTGQSPCPLYKIGNCGYVELNDNYTLLNGTASGVIEFVGPMYDNRVPVIVYDVYNKQGPLGSYFADNTIPLVSPDGYGPALTIVPSQEQTGLLTINVTFGDGYNTGSILLYFYHQLWGTIQITDTNTLLTGATNVKFPYMIAGYKRTVINNTAQTLTFEGTSGTGIAVGASKTAIIRCDGVNWVRVTQDV